jgi:hypothetical protein
VVTLGSEFRRATKVTVASMSSILLTDFVREDGWWRHRLTEEWKRIFMPGVTYKEFVAARR